MRSTKKGFRPRLETLEERWVPATVHDVAGNLLISNPSGNLTVTQTATAGQVSVMDNGGTITYSGVGSLIEITGSNLPDIISFNGTTGTTTFNGNLLISSGNGGDTVNLQGLVGGNVTLLTGFGADKLNLGATAAGAASTFSVGGSLTYFDSLGNDTVTTTGATTVGGSASLTGLQKLVLTSNLTVGGALTMTNLSAGFPLAVSGAGNLTVGSATGPFQSLTVTSVVGGNSSFALTGVLNVSGNASFNLGTGVDTLDLSAVAANSTIGGNLTFTDSNGSGKDTVNLGANLTVNGNATLSLGNGANALGLNDGFSVAGNLTIIEGNGANAAFTIGATSTVAGNLSITQGNGVNGMVTVGTPPAGTMYYKGGNGTDSLDLEGAAGSLYNVFLTFGTGKNTLAFDTANTGITYSGYVFGSGGMNTFTQGTNDMLVDITFVNFP